MKKVLLLILFLLTFSSTFACKIISTKWDRIKMTPDCFINQAFVWKLDKFQAVKYLFNNKLIDLSVPHIEYVYSWNDWQIIQSYPIWYILKFERYLPWLLSLLDWKFDKKYNNLLEKATKEGKIATVEKKYVYWYLISKMDFYTNNVFDLTWLKLYKISAWWILKEKIPQTCVAYTPYLRYKNQTIENYWKIDIWLIVNWENCIWVMDANNDEIDTLDLFEFVYWKKWHYTEFFKLNWKYVLKEDFDWTWNVVWIVKF